METTILVRSSSREDPYTLSVSSTESGLSVFCDCPAGEWGKYCKHKISVICGDEKILYDNMQIEDFRKISKWISESRYPDLVAEIQASEKELELAKKKVKDQKEKIARLMKEGLK